MRRKGTCTDTIQSLLRYVPALDGRYGVRFANMRIMDIVQDMISSKFFVENSGAPHIRKTRVRKTMIKFLKVLLLFVNLNKDPPVAKNFGITHLDYPTLYISSEKDILFMIQIADAFVTNFHKQVPSHANFFRRQSIDLLDKLYIFHLKQKREAFDL